MQVFSRRLRGVCARAGFVAAGLLLAGSVHAQTVAVRVPPVHGTVLAGQPAALPEDLRGKVGVLVVGFSQASREQAKAWGLRLATDYFGSHEVVYYEMAMLAEVPRMLRGMVVHKIKEDVSARGQVHFLPVTDHEADWKTACAYSAPDDAYVLLVDGNGGVVWRTGGGFSEAKYSELVQHLKAVPR